VENGHFSDLEVFIFLFLSFDSRYFERNDENPQAQGEERFYIGSNH
jgi:hypothetical protein